MSDIKKFISNFKDAVGGFQASFTLFACIADAQKPTWDIEYLNKIAQVLADIDKAKADGYIINSSTMSLSVTLLKIPTEEELKDKATFDKYQKALDVYVKITKAMDEVIKGGVNDDLVTFTVK